MTLACYSWAAFEETRSFFRNEAALASSLSPLTSILTHADMSQDTLTRASSSSALLRCHKFASRLSWYDTRDWSGV